MKLNKAILFFSFAALLILNSCGKPPRPANQALDKQHDSPFTTYLDFYKCGDPKEIIDGAYTQGAELLQPIQKARYIMTTDSSTAEVIKGEPVELERGQWYRLDIDMLNRAGFSILPQILIPDQMLMHQFFFQKTRVEGKEYMPHEGKGTIEYFYSDMLDNKLLKLPFGPIGFSGYIRFSEDFDDELAIRMILVHLNPPATKSTTEGKPYPFDEPATSLLGVKDIDSPFFIKFVQ